MAAKYYAFIDGEQRGPFSIDQLADAGVRPSTYVWSKEMADWDRADHVEEIRNEFQRHINFKKELTSNPVNRANGAPFGQQNSSTAQPSAPPPSRRFGIPLPEVTEPEDLSRPPQLSLTLAILSLILCFVPTGIAAVIFTLKSQKCWDRSLCRGSDLKEMSGETAEDLRRKSHEY